MTAPGGQEGRRRRPGAATAPDHRDPRLRGRRYAIPFDGVWGAALRLADGGIRGWVLEEAEAVEGRIRAQARTRVFRFVDDVEIRVGLDRDGQTRVDLTSTSRTGTWDLGTNARRIRSFFRRLDREVGATPAVTLDPREGAYGRRAPRPG